MTLNIGYDMKCSFKLGLLCAMLLAGTLPAAALDAVVIAHSGVKADRLSASELKDIYTGKKAYWDGGQAVVIAVLVGKTDAALKEASGMNASQFKTFWQRLAFSGRGQQPKNVDDGAAMVAWVSATPGAVALVPADAVLTGVKKIEVE
jgi:ABC-type phosphate transport system substrate-binding protein